MGRNTATINYAIGSSIGNTFNMYLFGSGILTSLHFLYGLLTTGTLSGAIDAALTYFISKLTPFPLNEFLTAGGFEEVAVNVLIALLIGIGVASYRYRTNAF
jgi:hypothetical protein